MTCQFLPEVFIPQFITTIPVWNCGTDVGKVGIMHGKVSAGIHFTVNDMETIIVIVFPASCVPSPPAATQPEIGSSVEIAVRHVPEAGFLLVYHNSQHPHIQREHGCFDQHPMSVNRTGDHVFIHRIIDESGVILTIAVCVYAVCRIIFYAD